MDTGSDEGDVGGTTDSTPLSDDERAILDRLRHAGGDEVVTDPPEETPAAGAAAEDDSPLPGSPPDRGGPDPLTAVFQEPSP